MTERQWCLVPDCDEQVEDGDELCRSHMREEMERFAREDRERNDDDGREYGHPGDRLRGIE